jgi:deoxycytidylate deaminase
MLTHAIAGASSRCDRARSTRCTVDGVACSARCSDDIRQAPLEAKANAIARAAEENRKDRKKPYAWLFPYPECKSSVMRAMIVEWADTADPPGFDEDVSVYIDGMQGGRHARPEKPV